jgi:transcriptional regulator with XRE-family HTH domain
MNNRKQHNLELIKEQEFSSKKIGDMLYELRDKKDWTLEELSIRTMDNQLKCVHKETIRLYESGQGININKLEKIVSAFGFKNIFEFFKKIKTL